MVDNICKDERELYESILHLKTVEECYAFFHDLCTPSEIKAMRERLVVANLLFLDDLSYREIHEKTKVSIATITRVARFLKQEKYQGYKMIFERMSDVFYYKKGEK